MKILQANNYGYIKGGSEKVFFETIELLKQNGHEVKAFCMDDEDNLKNDGITSIAIDKYEERKGVLSTFRAIKNFYYNSNVEKVFEKVVSEFKPDIIHIHIIYGRLSNAIIKVANKHKIPLIQSVHEFRLLCPIYTCLDKDRNICEKCASSIINLDCIIKKCSKGKLLNSMLVATECKYRDWVFCHQKRISAFIMVSEFIKNKHIEYFPEIRKKCHQIYNCIDTDFYSKYIVSNKCNNKRYYLYFGRLSYEKGIMTLVNYFSSHPEIQLKIIGTGPLMNDLQLRINQDSLDNIEILGYKSGESLYNYIANAYFTIVPSEWYENNPLTIIESLALGTPVIGNKIGGIPEIISDLKTGYIYDYTLENDLDRCIKASGDLNEGEYGNMINSCINAAYSMFSRDSHYKKLIEVYNTVLCNN